MHVIDGIRYGFDVGIKEQFSHSVIHPNHASSSLDMNFISSYIKSEVGAGRYAGPFTQAGLEALIGSFCTSPLGLVPKGSSSFRLIQDLSFPRDPSSVASINSQINSNDFPTAWGTFDITSSLILSLPEGCMAATFDISAAYRITPVRPDQQWALVVHWKDDFFVDRALPFGLASSAGIFGWVADLLVDLYVHSGQFGPLVKWVDDFFAVRLPHQSWTETDFTSHTAMFGVPWSLKKLRALNVIQWYIGFDWDLTTKSVSLPEEKKNSILTLITLWLASNGRFTVKDAQSLHGKLVFIASIFYLIRPYLPSIVHFAESFRDPRAKLHPPRSVHRDLEWIRFLLHVLPVSMPLSLPEPVDLNWWGDASTSFGIGIVIDDHWAAWQWAPPFQPSPTSVFNIGWAEAVAVELGVRLLTHLNLHHHPQGRRYLVRSDNMGVIEIIKKGRCRSTASNEVLKIIYRLLAESKISLQAQYVQSHENLADPISRGKISSFLRRFPKAVHKISLTPPSHLQSKLQCL